MERKWKYSRKQTPPAPIVELDMAGFPLELVVDTGFGGEILIPFSLFQSLGLLGALAPDTYHAVMPDSRRIQLYTSKVEVSLDSSATSFMAEVHSSDLLERKLVGRSFLRRFVAVLDGKKEVISLS